MLAAASGLGLWQYHQQPKFCAAVCHVMDPYLASWSESEFLVSAHADEGLACLDCHEASLEEQLHEAKVFVTNQYEDPLQMRYFPNEFCFACHEHASYEEVAARTTDYVINGATHNPHDPHPGVDEAIVGQFERLQLPQDAHEIRLRRSSAL